MRRVADHGDILKLERRFSTCPDPVGARHVQVIWLLAQGHTVGATSKVTAFGSRWIEQMPERYSASGPDALRSACAPTSPGGPKTTPRPNLADLVL